MLLLLTQPKLPLPYRTYYRTYHIYRLIIIILRMTKFPPNFVNMKNVNLTLHVSSRRVHCISVLGVHVSSASLASASASLAFRLAWRSVSPGVRSPGVRSPGVPSPRRSVSPAFGLPGVPPLGVRSRPPSND